MAYNYDRFQNSWSILPASCLFNSTKITLEEVAKEWDKGTVVVCRKPNGQIGFIAGSMGDYSKIGQNQKCHHDQTGASLGYWVPIAEVQYTTIDGVFKMEKVQGSLEGVKKATIHVFK